jgi:hypothetical protein
MLFFEKKNQKTFALGLRVRSGTLASRDESAGGKVFCFFFSKKKAFLLIQASADARRGVLPE